MHTIISSISNKNLHNNNHIKKFVLVKTINSECLLNTNKNISFKYYFYLKTHKQITTNIYIHFYKNIITYIVKIIQNIHNTYNSNTLLYIISTSNLLP